MYLLYRCLTPNSARTYLCQDLVFRPFKETQSSLAIDQGQGLEVFTHAGAVTTAAWAAYERERGQGYQYPALHIDNL